MERELLAPQFSEQFLEQLNKTCDNAKQFQQTSKGQENQTGSEDLPVSETNVVSSPEQEKEEKVSGNTDKVLDLILNGAWLDLGRVLIGT